MENSVYNYNGFHIERKTLVILGSQTSMFCCVISNHPSLSLRLL